MPERIECRSKTVEKNKKTGNEKKKILFCRGRWSTTAARTFKFQWSFEWESQDRKYDIKSECYDQATTHSQCLCVCMCECELVYAEIMRFFLQFINPKRKRKKSMTNVLYFNKFAFLLHSQLYIYSE